MMYEDTQIHKSVFDYLNPMNHFTPLIELRYLSGLKNNKARIFAKMAPMGNIKTIPAHYMLNQAWELGLLKEVHTLVEASSGNMAVALCDLCPYFKIENFLTVIANDTAQGKQQELHIKGAQIKFTNTLPENVTAIEYAKDLGKQKGFLNLWQYGNPHNPKGYERYFAPQIYEQLKKIGLVENYFVFCAAMGTCGTIMGCGNHFKERFLDCSIVGANLLPGQRVPGARDHERLLEIKLNWQEVVDEVVSVGRYKSYKRELELIHMGLDAGPSTGLALEGLVDFLNTHESKKDVVAVFICADGYKSYSDKPGTILDDEEFRKKLPLGI